MPDDYEDVDVGGTIHIRFTTDSSGTTTTSGSFGRSTAFHFQHAFKPGEQPYRPSPPPPRQMWDQAEAKRLYRLLSKKLHPDLHSGLIRGGRLNTTPEEWMKLLNAVMAKRDMKTLVVLADRFCPGSVNG